MRISKKNKGILDGQQKIKITKLYAGDYFGHVIKLFLIGSFGRRGFLDVQLRHKLFD
jgi:hypothetical protein